MKRREMLSLMAMGATPFVFKRSSAAGFSNSNPGILHSRFERFGDGRDWFFDNRYGMFIHWGIYSIPAWHEQIQWRGKMTRSQYVKFADEFNPKKFNPEKWLDLVQEAGMKYVTFTTKHHDGFCMWDTRQTKFNIMNTPYRKDILGMLSDACHKRKLPISLYYSIADWNHINYPNLGRHHELSRPEPGDQPDWNRYMEFLKAQVRELCTNYGEIYGIWWDMNVPEYYDPTVNAMIRKLQPKAVINNRGFDEGDFGTPERDLDKNAGEAKVFKTPTEACQSLDSLSWGYKRDAEYYSDRHLINSMDRYFSAGANYLLNVGPTAEGLIPDQSIAILKRIAKWYDSVKESFNKAQPVAQLVKSPDISVTRVDQAYYIHLNRTVIADGISLKPINVLPESAILLNDGRKIDFALTTSPSDYAEPKSYLRLNNLPVNEMPNTVLVIKLEFGDRIIQVS